MRTNVTQVQQNALRAIDTDSMALGVKGVTLDALQRKGLIRDRSTGNALRWDLTAAGKLLLGQVTGAPATAPAVPADPFAAFDQFNEGE